MRQQLVPALRMMVLLTILTGLIYPSILTGLCQVLFRDAANGSLVTIGGRTAGSRLIGQNFSKPEYFHPRPSAAGNDGYDPTASGGSNFGPTSQKLYDRVKGSAEQFRKENPDFKGSVPADAVTASASGLDPDISIPNALAQTDRVAKARGVSPEDVSNVVVALTDNRDLGFLGEPRVNVLKLNLELDQKFPKR